MLRKPDLDEEEYMDADERLRDAAYEKYSPKKITVLALLKILAEESDENHPMIVDVLIQKLMETELLVETPNNKTVTRDIYTLIAAGFNVKHVSRKGYYLVKDEFEDYEIKILADAISMARFLTKKDSKQILDKLYRRISSETCRLIKNDVVLDDDVKLRSPKFISNFKTVLQAIRENRRISFKYDKLGKEDPRLLHRNGHTYEVSPYHVVLANDNYYLICNSDSTDLPLHFVVSKLVDVKIEKEVRRPERDIDKLKKLFGNTEGYSLGQYLRENVNMWSGESVVAALRCRQDIRTEILAKFGNNINLHDQQDGTFTCTVRVADSEGFYAWVSSYGSAIELVAPAAMRKKLVQRIEEMLNKYK